MDHLKKTDLKKTILSNKPHNFTILTVEKLLPEWPFDFVLGHNPPTPKKPNPSSALKIAAKLNIPPENFLYVGDTDTDMKTAVTAGMFPVAALWGFRPADELKQHGAKFLAKHPLDILKLLSV